MPTEVTSSNAPADIVRAVQSTRAPGTLQVRSNAHAVHLLIVSGDQLVLPSLEPRPALDAPGIDLLFQVLDALHRHATATVQGLPEVAGLMRCAATCLHTAAPSPLPHQSTALRQYLDGSSGTRNQGMWVVHRAVWQQFERHPSPTTQTAAEVVGLCVALASQLALLTARSPDAFPPPAPPGSRS